MKTIIKRDEIKNGKYDNPIYNIDIPRMSSQW